MASPVAFLAWYYFHIHAEENTPSNDNVTYTPSASHCDDKILKTLHVRVATSHVHDEDDC